MSNTTPRGGVRFIATPFMPEYQPALGVSTLVALLESNDILSSVQYLNLDYLNRIGRNFYSYVCDKTPVHYLVGEMIFAPALWGWDDAVWDAYQKHIVGYHAKIGGKPGGDANDGVTWAGLREASKASPDIISEWAQLVLEDAPAVVGFTTTFQQNVASLALAKELRRRVPRERMRIIFGGANCDADMGRAIADGFPFVDHVVSGEADEVIVPLVKRILAEALGSQSSSEKLPRFIDGTAATDLGSLPVPQFKDYFDAIQTMEWKDDVRLVSEASRGCWWGEKMHCTFCGLNAMTMSYRSKRPEQFLEEIATLHERHKRSRFAMADNIMNMKYINNVFRSISVKNDDLRFFFETKSNLNKDQLEIMVAGGVDEIQPGIESLSTPILKLMKKGVSSIQNIQLLKWCVEFNVRCLWSLLWAFPMEPEEEYDRMARMIPKLFHLPAPLGAASIRLDRFSPYWKSPETYGLSNIKPYQSYDFAYRGINSAQRARIAYFFDYEHADGRAPRAYAAKALGAIDQWIVANRRHAALEFCDVKGARAILDTREQDGNQVTDISSEAHSLLKVLDSCKTRESAFNEMSQVLDVGGGKMGLQEFDKLLEEFIDRRWVIEEDKKLLSLVVDRNERMRVINRKFEWHMDEIGLALS